MTEFFSYVEIGFRHITDPRGLDHVLFLLALAAAEPLRAWRRTLVVMTAFTVGHTVTLGLAATELVTLPTTLVEFLIPVTIVVTCVQNLRARNSDGVATSLGVRVAAAGVFGLIHGAGFANFLRSLFVERLAVPLLGFNLGLEAGQLVVLLAAGALFALLDRGVAPRFRMVAVSASVGIVAGRMSLERFPW